MFDGMGVYEVLLIFSVVILIISLAGAYIPFLKKMDSRQVHLMVALSAGIFLGILFFMLLPETFDEVEAAGLDATDVVPWMICGFLAVVFIDVLMKRRHMHVCACEECVDKEHGHELTSFSAFAGLAVHAAVDGMILSIGLNAGEEIGMVALVGVSLHKFVELFSLSSTFMLTDMSKNNRLVYMIIFALITPAAALLSMPMINIVGGLDVFIPLAVATGTFMYVGIYALLPEAFHERRDSLVSFALVVTGIIAIALIMFMLGDTNIH
ncbi:MAG: ZIP family metal transporter [Methanomassiliicoccaceae archaeon]|nr:ZIP family metal transporter [Methanomassiliicoccaceae archaeon]